MSKTPAEWRERILAEPYQTPIEKLPMQIATATRLGRAAEADRLRTVLRTVKLAAKIRETVEATPPLSAEQIEYLRSLLDTGRSS